MLHIRRVRPQRRPIRCYIGFKVSTVHSSSPPGGSQQPTLITRVQRLGQDFHVAQSLAFLVDSGDVVVGRGHLGLEGAQFHVRTAIDAEELLGELPVQRNGGAFGHGGMAGWVLDQ